MMEIETIVQRRYRIEKGLNGIQLFFVIDIETECVVFWSPREFTCIWWIRNKIING